MNFGTQARGDWRALVSAALIGWGVGLALGGIYLGAGMGRAIAEHGRTVEVAQVSQALRGPLAGDPQAHVAAAAPQLAGYADPAKQVAATRARELDCMAQAVYFEARGESARGQAAVATVIMNRVKNPHFPKTVCGVVYQGASHRNGCQFSFACDGRPQRVSDWDAWDDARHVAARALSGVVLRDVGKATYFHTVDVAPGWSPSMLRVAQVGLHIFYKLNPHAPPQPVDDDAGDDSARFASRPAPAQTLRLAAALAPPPSAADPAVKAPAPAPSPAVEARPAPRAEPTVGPGPIASRTAPAQADAGTAAAS